MSKGEGKINSMLIKVDHRNGAGNYSKGFSDDVSQHFQNYLTLSGIGDVKDNATARQFYIDSVLRQSSASQNPDFLGGVNMNYTGGPNYNSDDYNVPGEFKKTASSPWVPNTTSPNSSGQREDSIEEDRYKDKQGTSPFTGMGTLLNPAQSASEIAATQNTLGSLMKGKRPGQT